MTPVCLSSTPYKGLFVLLLVFIVLEYFFNTISDTKSSLFFNNTKWPISRKEPPHTFGRPLLKTLLKNKPLNNTTNNTLPSTKASENSTKSFRLDNLSYIVTAPPFLFNNQTNFTSVAALFDPSTTEAENSSNINRIPIKNPNSSDTIPITVMPSCPDVSQYLYGRIPVSKSPIPTVQELEKRFSWLQPGGHWSPEACSVPQKVAIIIPFRCRGEHLLLFLQHMHPFLKRQQLDYTIFIVEQDGDGVFNRAMLMNIGYVEALKSRKYDCFIFHDIDLLPEDDRNLYTCPEQPRHMSVAIDIFKYRLPYPAIFGGVSAISRDHFKLLNGFSNSFWGWGGEDDDMSNRIRYHHLFLSRYPLTIARYTMLTHKKDKPSPNRYDVLKKGQKRFDKDGLNSLKYKLVQFKKNLLYTWILVEIEPPR